MGASNYKIARQPIPHHKPVFFSEILIVFPHEGQFTTVM